MKWTTRQFSTILKTRSIAWALSFVLFSAISPLVRAGEYSGYLDGISAQLTELNRAYNRAYFDVTNSLNAITGISYTGDSIYTFLSKISSALNYQQGTGPVTPTVMDYLEEMADYLYTMSTNGASGAGGTNVFNATDILAANPWWATNSAFAIHRNGYTSAYPDDGLNSSYSYSFPQFMSIWSSRLSIANVQPSSATLAGWWNFFGTPDVSQLTGQSLIRRGYTWFDWASDAMRSNMVLQTSIAHEASTDSAYIANVLESIRDYIALSQSESNAVNSAISSTAQYTYSNAVWISENTVTSNTLTQFVTDNPTSEEDPEISTNCPPDLEIQLPTAPNTDIFSGPLETLQSKLPVGFEGDPRILVIPEFTFGSSHSAAAYGDLLPYGSGGTGATGFVRVIQKFCKWVWAILAFLCCFGIVRTEYNFWTTLGGSANE